eukprot:TRINITY_DN1744_c0_g1_i6.p1 TRINITY_DN1744_c0_g1~~TRINITY_DN1744_c0_g1_i6.p1  ORF type:complete len:405 (-),score=71.20 TRINITY_DN1744_c0_g1_i6:556-1770(-)
MQEDLHSQSSHYRKPLHRKDLPTMQELIIPNSPRIPGYQGFLPGERDHIAESFGKFPLNHVAVQPNHVSNNPDLKLPEVHNLDHSIHLDHGRRIPGYKGHIPGAKNVYATTFSISTEEALQQTLAKMQIQEYHQNALPQIQGKAQGKAQSNPVANRVETSSCASVSSSSIPPGYTGYIPNSQHHYGHTFGDLVSKVDELHGDPNLIFKPDAFDHQSSVHRRQINSHIPGYTGYIQEHMYDYGKTYGKMTQDHIGNAHSMERNKPTTVPLPPLGPAERRALEAKIVFSDAARIPGYAGAIPGLREEYGSTFGKLSRIMITSPRGDGASNSVQLPSLKQEDHDGRGKIHHRVQAEAKQQPTIPSVQSLPSLKPYPPLEPQRSSQSARRHISGYTGFVPSKKTRSFD